MATASTAAAAVPYKWLAATVILLSLSSLAELALRPASAAAAAAAAGQGDEDQVVDDFAQELDADLAGGTNDTPPPKPGNKAEAGWEEMRGAGGRMHVQFCSQ